MPTVEKLYSGKVVGRKFFSITPATADIDPRPDAVYIGTGGDLEIVDEDGDTTVLTGMLGGVTHPISPVQILSANTTADDIVGIL